MTPSDGELARRALQGDAESAAALHDRYFDRIYDFCLRLLFDAEAAAAAAAETLRRALTTLSEPGALDSFRTHLFSNAVAVAVTRSLEGERPLEKAQTEDLQRVEPERLSNPLQAPLAQEEAGFVWEGVLRLDPRDYALLDLQRRQGLEVAELAAALQIGQQAAQRGLNKLTRDTESGISSLITARRGSRTCEGLRRALLGLPIAASGEQLQQATERHVRSCPVCTTTRLALVPPFEVLGALAAVPPSWGLREKARERALAAWGTGATPPPTDTTPKIASPSPVFGGAAVGAGGGGRRRPPIGTGALGDRWRRLISGHNLILPLGAALLVLLAAWGIAWGTGMFGGSGGGTALTTPTPTATATATAVPSATAAPSPTATDTAAPTVEPSSTPEEEATPTATTPPETATPAETSTPEVTPLPIDTATPEPLPSETAEPSPTP